MKAERIMKRFLSVLFLFLFIGFFAGPFSVGANTFVHWKETLPKAHPEYVRGVNNALNAIILLNLELSLYGERKTFGEMSDIVRKRLHVRKTQ